MASSIESRVAEEISQKRAKAKETMHAYFSSSRNLDDRISDLRWTRSSTNYYTIGVLARVCFDDDTVSVDTTHGNGEREEPDVEVEMSIPNTMLLSTNSNHLKATTNDNVNSSRDNLIDTDFEDFRSPGKKHLKQCVEKGSAVESGFGKKPTFKKNYDLIRKF